ncbi:MAG TPA: hypothetical protein VGK67_22280 [Myxococcales bacterium]|jgi:hypothetical protein
MDRVSKLEHRGRTVVLIDVSGCKAKEAAEVLIAGRVLVATFAPASALTLTDVTGTTFDDAATREAQTNARQNAPFVKAGALVGVTGLKKIVYTAVTRLTGRNFSVFDDRQKALDWLAQQ